MRIAQLSPLRVAVPPRDYGGTERVIYNITEALVHLGHDVSLYASGDSQTSAHLISMVPDALSFSANVEWQADYVAMLARVYKEAYHYDVIHSHMDYLGLPFIKTSKTPTVLTLHGRLDKPEFLHVFKAFPETNYISISNAQRAPLGNDVNWVGTVYHSVDVDNFSFYRHHGDYLAFVGRISPEKRPDRAIEVAKKTGIPLKIAAKIDPADQEYFETQIKPLMDHPLVEFLGILDEQGKRELMGNALALILPIDWPEPFGMVFIEALACGTPVLTCPCGSVPEILEDGLTGYIRNSVDELAEAALMIRDRISRYRCRKYAKRRFDVRRQALDYITIYNKVCKYKSIPFYSDVSVSSPLDEKAILINPGLKIGKDKIVPIPFPTKHDIPDLIQQSYQHQMADDEA
jgi:glycosyltransferase involved in cell wall biosynthesis